MDDTIEESAGAAPLDVLIRLAARCCGAPVQLCLFEGPHRGSRTTDPRVLDVSDFAHEVVGRGQLSFGVRSFAGQTIDLVGRPIFADGRAIGALCLFGSPGGDAAEHALADVALMISRECEGAGAAGRSAPSPASDNQIPEMLAAMIDSVPVAVALYDTDFKLLRVSERWGFDFGLRPERMIGRSMFEIDPTARRWEAAYRNCLQGERLVADRVPIQRKDGREVYINAVTIPWKRTDGRIGGIMGMYQVLMDDRGEEYELINAQRRLQKAIDLAGIAVWEMDYRTKSVWGMGEGIFDEGSRTTGFFEMVEDAAAGIHPDDRPRVTAELAEAREEGRAYRGEYRMHRLDDRELWVAAAQANTYDDDGAIETRLGVLVDITQRKKAEQALIDAMAEAEAANRAKSDFLATMSHEIRTPLNGVLGMARAMAADELTPAQRERLEVVRQSGESLLALLNDVLDLSKVEAGKLELDPEPFDLVALAKGAHATFLGVAQSKGLTLDLVIEQGARGAYLGDATRVRQILSNLISNALKFTDHGGAKVTIAARKKGFTIKVRDTGIGIPADRIARLFHKFEQADASTTRRFGGTGLGLAISRQLAEMMGGTIRVSSAPGAGATFTVALPLAKLDGAAVVAPAEPAANTTAAEIEPQALRVLAAEDNKVNQLVLRTLLNQAGVDPVIVEDGRQAVEAWEHGEWDVILMDVQMPVMDGPAAARIIRQREAASGRIKTPIVALTANVMSHQVREYEAAGMNGWVAKPIEVAALFASLETALALKEELASQAA
ncbi:MAG TPA: ATP-binding protein [Caulobacteraceae bacterium]|nr:ATP-binding protein [Caulobacteraceae bacterium]